MLKHVEYNKQVLVYGSYDVLVVGGGPSGLCAAVAAAQCGAKVALIERYGTLGGNLTIGHVGPIMGRVAPGTLGAYVNHMAGTKLPINRVAPDLERLKTGLTEWVMGEGVNVLLQTAIADVIMEGQRIQGVIASTPTGLRAFLATAVVDATGDGLVAALSDAPFEMGREEDGLLQPVSLMFSIGGLEDNKIVPEGSSTFDSLTRSDPFKEMVVEASRTGLLPRPVSIVRLYRTYRPNECYVNATHKNFVDGTDLKQIAQAERELRAQIPWIIEYLRTNVHGCENAYLIHSSDTLGVRETRRVLGEYVLNEQDLQAGRKFEDVVVHNANFFFDVHGMKSGGQDSVEQVKCYDIPYGCLVPQKVEGLVLVGRCISGTHLAHSSYRVMNIVMAIGQAGGVAAALSVKENVLPRQLSCKAVQERLTEMGVDLFS